MIYPKGFSDFEKVKLSVISSNCLSDDLNLGRKKNLENSKLIYGDECSF